MICESSTIGRSSEFLSTLLEIYIDPYLYLLYIVYTCISDLYVIDRNSYRHVVQVHEIIDSSLLWKSVREINRILKNSIA